MKTENWFTTKVLIWILVIVLIVSMVSCNEKEASQKRAYVVGKSDDGNWTTSAVIECDSVDMITENHAVYWVDGKKFNLKGRTIKIYSTNRVQ